MAVGERRGEVPKCEDSLRANGHLPKARKANPIAQKGKLALAYLLQFVQLGWFCSHFNPLLKLQVA